MKTYQREVEGVFCGQFGIENRELHRGRVHVDRVNETCATLELVHVGNPRGRNDVLGVSGHRENLRVHTEIMWRFKGGLCACHLALDGDNAMVPYELMQLARQSVSVYKQTARPKSSTKQTRTTHFRSPETNRIKR